MKSEFHLLHEINTNFDSIIPLDSGCRQENDSIKKNRINYCNHIGFFVKDGTNSSNSSTTQRFKCQKCDKRFGNNINEWKLIEYNYKLQILLYEIFIEGCKQVNLSKRWGIPQEMISRFKKRYITQVFEQHPRLLNVENKHLKYGVIYGDETFFGKRGNSNQEIIFCNEDFEILATKPALPKHLQQSILSAFNSIPKCHRNNLRVLVTDGEPSYKSIVLNNSYRIIHVQQFHSKPQLGQITINKYEKFDPHTLHYQIHTHWKFFTQKKKDIGFKWEIRFIRSQIQANRGGPTIQMRNDPLYIQWLSKKNEYYSPQFQKVGTAHVYVNLSSRKITLRKGSKQWMKKMLQPLIPIFNGKHITNNRIESKNSQIKRCGESRKQPDADYSDKIVQLYEYIVQHNRLPYVNLNGRPLFKYLMKKINTTHVSYGSRQKGANISQKIISAYY